MIPLLLTGCGSNLSKYATTQLYYGGTIITVDERNSTAEAVLVGDGVIVAVGRTATLMRRALPSTERIDLDGLVMMPGFVDSHSHISMVGKFADLSPAEGVVNIDSLVAIGRREADKWYTKSKEASTLDEGDWFVATGYDNTVFPNAAKPTADDLDKISTMFPVVVVHASNHTAVVNHRGLEVLGYRKGSAATDRFGALIGRDSNGNPNGQIDEDAFFRLYYDPEVMTDPLKTNTDDPVELLKSAVDLYAFYGITTAQDGAGSPIPQTVEELYARGDSLKIDIVDYGSPQIMEGRSSEARYRDRIKEAGVKLILDGSPQAKTAWLQEPYYIVPDGMAPDYRGTGSMSDEELYRQLREAVENGWQVYAHTNGSAAIDQFLRIWQRVRRDTGSIDDLRPVLIHAQTITEEELDRAEAEGVNVSFFADHTYYWGDYHLTSTLGPERGSQISPLRSATKRNINVTLHQDSPVVPPNMLRTIQNAVLRRTRDGREIGPNQAITPMEAIRMLTINGAYQYFEEQTKGSIEVGKLADFVILSANPLTVAPDKIENIRVVATIKEGSFIYLNPEYISDYGQ